MKTLRTLLVLCLVALCSSMSFAKKDNKADKNENGIPPSFQGGGVNKFAKWLSERIEYPSDLMDQKIEGRVETRFIIEKNGSMTFDSIMESPSPILSNVVLQLALQAPLWEPAKLFTGEPVRCYIVVPVNFKLEKQEFLRKSIRPYGSKLMYH